MRPRQTILLGLLLLVPVLAFLSLYGFGRNHYVLPTFLPERIEAAQPAVAVGAVAGQPDTVYHRVQPFELVGLGGRMVSSRELGQGPYVVQFLGDSAVSAAATAMMARIQEKFRPDPRVRLATLVPNLNLEKAAAEESAGVEMAQLSARYGTISGKWFFLTGAPSALQRLARAEFGQTALNPARYPFRPDTEPTNLLPGRLLLVDRAGHVRGYYEVADKYEVERLITEINVLLYTYDHHD